MIYKIKKVQAILKNEIIELPDKLRIQINENFEKIKQTGANIWNGEVFCVSECNIKDEIAKIICNKSDYAHYLYGEKIGVLKQYECKSLSAGCLIETVDGYYIVGELDDSTSYPTMLQVTGGGIDKKDIFNNNIDIEQTIAREAMEELNINLNDKENIVYDGISYIYITEENELSGVQIFSKAKTKMTAKEMQKHFEEYYKFLKENNLEIEFKKLYFIKKTNALEEVSKLENPRRNYLIPLLRIDSQI